MLGIKFRYKNTKGQSIDITEKTPQYLYLEPLGKVVVRYYFVKDGLEVNATKLISDVLEPGVLSVKIRPPASVFLSPVSDFRNLPERLDAADYFEIDFSLSDTVPMDVLYASKVEERLKIKVKDLAAGEDSFENENTVTDGPDAFVKIVGVVIRPQNVYYVYIHRREGRLKKAPSTVEYSRFAPILKSRMFDPTDIDRSLSFASILRGLIKEEWYIDYSEGKIYKKIDEKGIAITDEELGDVIREYGDIRDIVNLLSTLDVKISNHPLIKESESFYVSCDGDCSLPAAIPQNTIDERGL